MQCLSEFFRSTRALAAGVGTALVVGMTTYGEYHLGSS